MPCKKIIFSLHLMNNANLKSQSILPILRVFKPKRTLNEFTGYLKNNGHKALRSLIACANQESGLLGASSESCFR